MDALMRRSARKNGQKGSVLLETILAIFIMTVSGLALLGLAGEASIVSFGTHRKMDRGIPALTAFCGLKNVDTYK